MPAPDAATTSPVVWSTPLRTRFRGLDVRDGVLLRGEAGWGELSPFWDYDDAESATWLRAAREAADLGWPAPVRDRVPVNVTVPAVGPERAREIVLGSGGCRTAKVKVAQRLPDGAVEPLDAEVARVGAVRDAFVELYGEGGARVRVDANGGWTVDEALARTPVLDAAAGGLEYVEQPCATVEELAEVRRRLTAAVPVAADESIRRAADPLRVVREEAADVVVLKVQPLGGVRACLELAEKVGLPVVVSSALESSVGLAAGVALAAALPDLPYACGLATSQLLERDVTASPLLPVDGALPVRRVDPDAASLAAAAPSDEVRDRWLARHDRLAALLAEDGR
ncbi:o-succinylbenzoate synthase [Isoptericola variabilis]|uniref:o-succinylbenzoate synthase n=1 Tax=Isoptericola variabilis (strain 225) TaxID=743718 RepID=F6FV90_ISOV2|nr:o-succinylbenzoate synthase [Isoptericola variabilis]AEG43363.1 Mandelate racemase/muconate lactonizing protein [Isoptericola variabilis 225]TWH34584.1 O-succinylbenzoate synthase [Isoptericola variabilis J7]